MADKLASTGIPPVTDWKKLLRSGNRAFIGSNAGCPHGLIRSLLEAASEFSDVELVHLLTVGETPWVRPEYRDNFRVNALFLGAETREAVAAGRADYTPCFLSEVPSLFLNDILPLDVALVQVSPPDAQGYCSLGVAVDVVAAACRAARTVVAQINPAMPRTLGESFIHKSQINAALWIDEPIPELPSPAQNDVTMKIGRYVSLLIDDGATLQLGIGKIPDGVLRQLGDRKDLGIHTEMFSDGVIDLMRSGVINNRRKTLHVGKSVVSFCMGTRRLYDFVHENPHVAFYPTEYTNNPAVIARNDNMVSINSALEVDLTGQVAADSMGFKFYSGIGGQVDFIRGAALSKGGKPIIALPSTAKSGTRSRIVPLLSPGTGVVTSRGDVHYVVTEYGIATLRGKSVRERALQLIQVAHPDFREELLSEVRKHFGAQIFAISLPQTVAELGEVDVIPMALKDGKYFLRPLRPADERALQEFFYSHNKETLERRYREHPRRMSREMAQGTIGLAANQGGVALGIVSVAGQRDEIHAVGQYQVDPARNTAEVSFVVRETKRRRGMARILLKRLIEVARKRNLQGLTATYGKENTAIQRLLLKHGFSLSTTIAAAGMDLKAELDLTRVAVPAAQGEEESPAEETT